MYTKMFKFVEIYNTVLTLDKKLNIFIDGMPFYNHINKLQTLESIRFLAHSVF